MAKRGINWYLSALLGVGAVAFGFWLGVVVLNWYSDRDYNLKQTEKARPVSILSGKEEKSKDKNGKDDSDALIIKVIDNEDELASLDSLGNSYPTSLDSLALESLNSANGFENGTNLGAQTLEDFHFIKRDQDQLVATVSFVIPKESNTNSQSTQQLDSILGKPQSSNPKERTITVELWKSPLNFRGYKFSNNVLVVYDMTQVDFLKLYQSDGKLYLSYFDVFYNIAPTTQFKALKPTNTPF